MNNITITIKGNNEHPVHEELEEMKALIQKNYTVVKQTESESDNGIPKVKLTVELGTPVRPVKRKNAEMNGSSTTLFSSPKRSKMVDDDDDEAVGSIQNMDDSNEEAEPTQELFDDSGDEEAEPIQELKISKSFLTVLELAKLIGSQLDSRGEASYIRKMLRKKGDIKSTFWKSERKQTRWQIPTKELAKVALENGDNNGPYDQLLKAVSYKKANGGKFKGGLREVYATIKSKLLIMH